MTEVAAYFGQNVTPKALVHTYGGLKQKAELLRVARLTGQEIGDVQLGGLGAAKAKHCQIYISLSSPLSHHDIFTSTNVMTMLIL